MLVVPQSEGSRIISGWGGPTEQDPRTTASCQKRNQIVHSDHRVAQTLQVLDEPAAEQSDPTLLNLQLRALGKEAAGVKMQVLGSIPHKAPDR